MLNLSTQKRLEEHLGILLGIVKMFLQKVIKFFYKRCDSSIWRGPGYILGKRGNIVDVRHASRFVRVPICRVRLAGWQTENLSKTCNSDNGEEVNDVNSDSFGKKSSFMSNDDNTITNNGNNDEDENNFWSFLTIFGHFCSLLVVFYNFRIFM